MTIASLARLRAPWRRFRRSKPGGLRAVTLGPGHEDWAVVDAGGRVVYRGSMLHAARLANELSRSA